MIIKFKKLDSNAVAPVQAYQQAAGGDLTAISVEYDKEHKCYSYNTGIAVEIPKGHVGFLFPRSSVYKTQLTLTNCVGVIDADYRGPICAKFAYRKVYPWYKRLIHKIKGIKPEDVAPYKVGDRICQLVITTYTICEYKESDTLSKTERGDKGYGSSDKK